MESESRYAVVGAFIFAIFAAAIVFIIWLGQVSFDTEYSEYQVVFKGPVRGLSQSGEVRFNGIKVGEVNHLALDPEDPNMVLARIRILAQTPIKEDSYAQLEPQGITGLSYIQIYGGSTNSKKLTRMPGDAYAKIPAKTAQIDDLVAGGEDLILSANTALVRINALLSTKNIEEFSKTLANIQSISSQLSEEGSLANDLGEALRATASAAQEIENTARSFSELGKSGNRLIAEDAKEMIAQIETAASELQATSKQAGELIAQVSDPLDRFSDEGVSEIILALRDMRAVLQSMERVIEEVDRDPLEFMAGEPITEVEVPR